MKKTILLLLVFILLFCTSCKNADKPDESSSDDDYTDNYIYCKLGDVFYRFNVKTATATPVCPDPLCKHTDDNCPFYGVEDVCFSGKFIYYLKGKTESICDRLCRFNLENGEYKTLHKTDSGYILRMFIYNNYVYFNQTVFESDSYVPKYNLLRYNNQSDKTEIMTEAPLDTAQTAYSAEDGRLYWYSDTGGDLYSTDTDYKNRVEGDEVYSSTRLIGKYGYTTLPNGEMLGGPGYKLPAFRVTATDRETGNQFTVLDGVCPVPYIVEDKLLYNLMQDNAELIGYISDDDNGDGENTPVYNRRGGKIYICDEDGENKHLLCDITQSGYIIGEEGAVSCGSNGDWFALRVERYTTTGEKKGKTIIEHLPDAIILINIITGEYKVAEVE